MVVGATTEESVRLGMPSLRAINQIETWLQTQVEPETPAALAG